MPHFKFDPVQLPPACDSLRAEVRAFQAREQAAGTFSPAPDGGRAWPPVSRRGGGAAGFSGLPLPL
jgi:hypothetical protein